MQDTSEETAMEEVLWVGENTLVDGLGGPDTLSLVILPPAVSGFVAQVGDMGGREQEHMKELSERRESLRIVLSRTHVNLAYFLDQSKSNPSCEVPPSGLLPTQLAFCVYPSPHSAMRLTVSLALQVQRLHCKYFVSSRMLVSSIRAPSPFSHTHTAHHNTFNA